MANSIKDEIIDRVVDYLLDLLADTSKEEVKNLLDRNKQQRILYKVINSFANSVYFNNEFKNITYRDNKDAVLSIPDDDINASKTIEQITSSISAVIEECFLTEDKSMLNTIAYHVANIYIQRAKMTIQVYDIIETQREGFDAISGNISELKNIVLSNHRYELQLRQEKEYLLKKELTNEVSNIISEIMNHYLYFVLKKSPTFSGEKMGHLGVAMAEKIEDTINHISDFVNDDFCLVPICVSKANGLEFKSEEINYFVYSECYFRNLILKNTDKLLKYKDIIDVENYVLILRLRNKIQGVLFPPLLEMGQTNIVKCNNYSIDVSFFRKEISEIGKLIVLLHNIMLS